MYAVPALARQIEREWAEELARHYGRSPEEVGDKVRTWFGFPLGMLRIELMDGSCVEFRCAISIVSESKKAIAVFTEHCGHHIFPYHDAKVFHDEKLVYQQKSTLQS